MTSATLSAVVQAQAFDGRWHDHAGWHPWLSLLFFAVIGVVLGFAVWALLRATRPAHHFAGMPHAPVDPALETLRMRFARGEIDAAEYAARAAHLSGSVPPAATPPYPPAPPAPTEPPAPPAP